MPSKNYFYLILSCFFSGLLFIAIQKQWLILRFPTTKQFADIQTGSNKTVYHKKKIVLFCWKNDNWFSEQSEILWSNETAENITNLIQNWLTLLDDEKLTSNKITLQTVLLTPTKQTAYLSFDQALFSKDANTYQKLMLVESLLKTLRTNQITTPYVQFLVQHQLTKDPHLDFNNPWPISGFLTN